MSSSVLDRNKVNKKVLHPATLPEKSKSNSQRSPSPYDSVLADFQRGEGSGKGNLISQSPHAPSLQKCVKMSWLVIGIIGKLAINTVLQVKVEENKFWQG